MTVRSLESSSDIPIINPKRNMPEEAYKVHGFTKEFLSDKRIIELTRFIWFPILFFIILVVRPKKSGKLYEKIWDKKRNKSPLKVFSESVAEKLQKKYLSLVVVILVFT